MEREERHFKQFVFPRTVDAVVQSTAPKKAAMWYWLVPLPIAAVLALVFLKPAGPPEDYVGMKGGSVGLSIYALDDRRGGPSLLMNEATVSSTAKLRFQVHPSSACYLWIFSIDQTGQISRLFPVTGEAQKIAEATTLPGGATLDGSLGFERFTAVCTTSPIAYGQVVEVVRHTKINDAFTLGRLTSIDGFPQDTLQQSILVEKRP